MSALLIAFAAMGCAEFPDAASVAANTQLSDDAYHPSRVVLGPPMQFDNYCYYQLTDDGKAVYLFVDVIADDWLFLDSAYEVGGRRLALVKVDQKVLGEGAGIKEVVAVTMPPAELVGLRQQGLNMRIEGQRDNIIVNVPAYYFEGFFKKRNELAGG